jgi:hypothetical protein
MDTVMTRVITVLITTTENGRISVDVRGPVKGKEGMLDILDAARELVEQGNFNTGHGRSSSGN